MITWSVNLNPTRLCPELTAEGLAAATPRAWQHLEALGVGGIRVDLHWAWLEPSPGRVNPEALAWYRTFFAEAARRDVAVYVLLYHPPAWALALLSRDEPAFLEAWSRFCCLVRRAFAGQLALVQIWNEPNNFLAGLKGDPVLFHTRRLGPWSLPVAVRWETLAALFRIARATFGPDVPLVYNVLANLSPFLPLAGTWLDWEHFTDRFLALAGDDVDVIALDHYPDTWAPGTGPLAWDCLDLAEVRVNTPGDRWYGKRVMLGEVGYSCAPNFHLVNAPVKLGRFFPHDRDEASMAAWYAAALTHLAERLTPARFPHNRGAWINLYELYDAPRPVGSHPALALEDHFGLVRRDGGLKPAYGVLQAAARGELACDLASLPTPQLPAYWHVARWGRQLQRRLAAWHSPAAPAAPRFLERTVPAARPLLEGTPAGDGLPQ